MKRLNCIVQELTNLIKNKKILPKIFQKRFLKVLPCTIYKQISLLKFYQNFDFEKVVI